MSGGSSVEDIVLRLSCLAEEMTVACATMVSSCQPVVIFWTTESGTTQVVAVSACSLLRFWGYRKDFGELTVQVESFRGR